jgi:hypothetical protein
MIQIGTKIELVIKLIHKNSRLTTLCINLFLKIKILIRRINITHLKHLNDKQPIDIDLGRNIGNFDIEGEVVLIERDGLRPVDG